MIEIWQRHADAIRVLRAYAPIPGADVIGSEEVWAAESIGQALQPADVRASFERLFVAKSPGAPKR